VLPGLVSRPAAVQTYNVTLKVRDRWSRSCVEEAAAREEGGSQAPVISALIPPPSGQTAALHIRGGKYLNHTNTMQ